MQLKGLAKNHTEWLLQREKDMQNDLVKSDLTVDLFKQYKKHLGAFRYFVLIEGEKLIIPEKVRKLLGFSKFSFLTFDCSSLQIKPQSAFRFNHQKTYSSQKV